MTGLENVWYWVNENLFRFGAGFGAVVGLFTIKDHLRRSYPSLFCNLKIVRLDATAEHVESDKKAHVRFGIYLTVGPTINRSNSIKNLVVKTRGKVIVNNFYCGETKADGPTRVGKNFLLPYETRYRGARFFWSVKFEDEYGKRYYWWQFEKIKSALP